jgi:hypothetical protein
MTNNVTSMADKRKRDASKRVKNLLGIFKPKTKQEKQNELINKRMEMQQKSDDPL